MSKSSLPVYRRQLGKGPPESPVPCSSCHLTENAKPLCADSSLGFYGLGPKNAFASVDPHGRISRSAKLHPKRVEFPHSLARPGSGGLCRCVTFDREARDLVTGWRSNTQDVRETAASFHQASLLIELYEVMLMRPSERPRDGPAISVTIDFLFGDIKNVGPERVADAGQISRLGAKRAAAKAGRTDPLPIGVHNLGTPHPL